MPSGKGRPMSKALAPGAVIGIMGGGQLGRMLAMAAARLGYKAHIYAPPGDNPAFDVAAAHTEAFYDDIAALDVFAGATDVVTFEFENIPPESLRHIAKQVPVLPDPDVLALTCDRVMEKNMAVKLGIPVPDFFAVEDLVGLEAAVEKIGRPAVLKTRRFGYDGKGQALIRPDSDLAACWDEIAGAASIVEAFVPFSKEISVIAAQGSAGSFAVFDIPENRHENHILRSSHVPADISKGIRAQAMDIARKLAGEMDYIGVFAVELFLTGQGGDEQLYMNEIAPRVHNSGHWTSAACHISQFEQHIRAISGLSLGDPVRHSDALMRNLLGKEALELEKMAAEAGACIELYGKREVRVGRKMGHVTYITPKIA